MNVTGGGPPTDIELTEEDVLVMSMGGYIVGASGSDLQEVGMAEINADVQPSLEEIIGISDNNIDQQYEMESLVDSDCEINFDHEEIDEPLVELEVEEMTDSPHQQTQATSAAPAQSRNQRKYRSLGGLAKKSTDNSSTLVKNMETLLKEHRESNELQKISNELQREAIQLQKENNQLLRQLIAKNN